MEYYVRTRTHGMDVYAYMHGSWLSWFNDDGKISQGE